MDEISKDLSCLTERQRTAYLLRKQGMTYQAIGQKMGGIGVGGVRSHVVLAERRLREYAARQELKEQNRQPASIELTRGELKIILIALDAYERDIMRRTKFKDLSELRDKLPDAAKTIVDIHRKAKESLYGTDNEKTRLFMGVFDEPAQSNNGE